MIERLQKILAKAGYGSRRSNEALITAGRVTINGSVAKLGDKADSQNDTIRVDGRPIVIEEPVYIMLNKPKGIISSLEDELDQGRTTVRDLVKVKGHIYPVGRLDKESEGLIVLTNDGQLAHHLTHPRYGHEKEYKVAVEGQIESTTLNKWREGVELDGRKSAPARIVVEGTEGDITWLRITIREGRKRQIRRIAALLGHPVTRLIRLRIGSLHLADLEPATWRHLTRDEVAALQRTAFKHGPKRSSR